MLGFGNFLRIKSNNGVILKLVKLYGFEQKICSCRQSPCSSPAVLLSLCETGEKCDVQIYTPNIKYCVYLI